MRSWQRSLCLTGSGMQLKWRARSVDFGRRLCLDIRIGTPQLIYNHFKPFQTMHGESASIESEQHIEVLKNEFLIKEA